MKNSAPSLRELQTWLRWLLTDPRGVDEALGDPKPSVEHYPERYTSPTPSYLQFIDRPPGASQESRLGVYAEAYFSRLVEALQADFPRLHWALGQNEFERLVAHYLKAHPSQTFTIGEVGRSLPVFMQSLRGHWIKQSTQRQVLYFQLAQFDWQMIESFYADESTTLNSQDLGTLGEDDWDRISFALDPSVRLISSKFPLKSFWDLAVSNEDADPADPSLMEALGEKNVESYFVFYRQNAIVRFEEIPYLDWVALTSLQKGMALPLALAQVETAAAGLGDAEELSQQVMKSFGSWMTRGLLSGFKLLSNEET